MTTDASKNVCVALGRDVVNVEAIKRSFSKFQNKEMNLKDKVWICMASASNEDFLRFNNFQATFNDLYYKVLSQLDKKILKTLRNSEDYENVVLQYEDT